MNSLYTEGQVGVSPDGKTMTFTSNKPDELKQGSTDLYVSYRCKVTGKRCR